VLSCDSVQFIAISNHHPDYPCVYVRAYVYVYVYVYVCVFFFFFFLFFGLVQYGEGFLKFAKSHRDDVKTFGRFPHRNAILGRESTAEELEYLKKGGGY
jgi:Bacterial protein of unknown function (DUF924)